MDKYKLIAKLNNHTDTTELISYTNNRIIITEETALSLIEHKNDILKQTGRIELSFSALNLIVKTFINSAYIDQHSFKETIYVITEIFYTLKNVTDEVVFSSDGDTIWVCRNCGHVVIGKNAPKVCPVCAHPQSFFERKAQNY